MAKKAKQKNPREMDDREIDQQLRDMQEKSFRIHFQMSMGQTDGLRRERELTAAGSK